MPDCREALTALLIKYEAPADMISLEVTLDELGLDSLAVVEMSMELGLDDSKVETTHTVAYMLKLLEAERNGPRQ